VKLLFDENLSARLAGRLADVYPGSQHVSEVGLGSSDDAAVWEFARAQGFAIVSKDSDFHQRSFRPTQGDLASAWQLYDAAGRRPHTRARSGP